MNIIAAIDKNNGIGLKGQLLEYIREDIATFKSITTNNVVVMGRKTFESIGCKPLKNRINIILTSDTNYKVENALVAHSFDELMIMLNNFKSDSIYIIGGAKVYELMFEFCDRLCITHIEKEYESDTKFPKIDMYKWKVTYESRKLKSESGTEYYYRIYSKL